MKRPATLLILLAMTICIGACGGKSKDDSRPADTEDTEKIVEDTGEIEEESPFLGDYSLIYFQNGPLALALDNNKGDLGALDASGRFAIPCDYMDLYYIGHDRYAVSKGEDNVSCTYGIVDLEGNEILPCEFATLGFEISDERDPCPELAGPEYYLKGYKEQENVIISAQKKKGGPVEYYSIIDGKSVDKPDKDQIMNFDYLQMEYHPATGEVNIPDSIKDKYENVFAISYGSNVCLDNKNVQCHYYGVWNYGDGGIRIVNAEGKEIGNGQKWCEVGVEYGNGLIAVRKEEDGLWGLIDSEGNEVTDFNFDVWLDNA